MIQTSVDNGLPISRNTLLIFFLSIFMMAARFEHTIGKDIVQNVQGGNGSIKIILNYAAIFINSMSIIV